MLTPSKMHRSYPIQSTAFLPIPGTPCSAIPGTPCSHFPDTLGLSLLRAHPSPVLSALQSRYFVFSSVQVSILHTVLANPGIQSTNLDTVITPIQVLHSHPNPVTHGSPRPQSKGMSYTTFQLSVTPSNTSYLHYTCVVKNVGKSDGDEVVQVYHSAGAAIRAAATHPVPLQSLVEFQVLSTPLHDV